jgi:hypothetical protein
MPVHESDSRVLTITLRPWLLWLFSSVLAAMGLLIIVMFGQLSQLVCDRSQTDDYGWCELSQVSLHYSRTVYLPVSAVNEVRTLPPTDQMAQWDAIWLKVGDRYIPFSLTTLGDRDRRVIALRIRRFLLNPELSTLEIVDDSRWFAYSFGSGFVLSGLTISLLFGKVVICTFDRTTQQFDLDRQGLLSHYHHSYPLDAIAAVDVDTSAGSSGSTYRVAIWLNDASTQAKQMLPLTPYYSSGLKDKQAVVDRIQTFLDA